MENANFSATKIGYSQTDINRNARKGPEEGWYKFIVTGAESKVSKNKGSMMFELSCSMVDEQGNTRGRPIKNWLVIPLTTPDELLTLAGFPAGFKHTAPKTSGLVRSYLEATRPADFPHDLVYDTETRKYSRNGEVLSKAETVAALREHADQVLAFCTAAWENPEAVFVGDTFYGKLGYQEDRDNASIVKVRAGLPEGETLVVIK